MLNLSEEGRRVVDALLQAPVAWQSPAELASATGRGLDEMTDLLAFLDADGWLSAWEREADVVVTLSVAAASRLGVRLVESGQNEVPRWARQGDPEPPSLRASGVFRGERAARLELVVDPSIAPHEALERAEASLTRRPNPADSRPRSLMEGLASPTLLVGTGLSPWPGPGEGRKGSCPCCHSIRMMATMYCLYCDRWGLDYLLNDQPIPRILTATDPKDDARRRELERQSRKTRRKSRRAAQAAAGQNAKRRPLQAQG